MTLTHPLECLERLLDMEVEDEQQQQTMFFNIQYAGRQWMTTRRFPSIFNPPRPPRNEIKCPTCKKENRITHRDISTLTKNFALLGLRTQAAINIHPKKSHYCKDHDHEKRIYCSDCKMLICAYCQLYGEHKEHTCEIATDAAKPAVDRLKEARDQLTRDMEDVTNGEEAVRSVIDKIELDKIQSQRKIKRYFNKYINRLRLRREGLLRELEEWCYESLSLLGAQCK